MKAKLFAGMLVVCVGQIAAADSRIEEAQQALKAQGFYYGQVTGEKNADTTAAIRRFQIRFGLQVTGKLNEETSTALKQGRSASSSGSATTPVPASTPTRQNAPATTPPIAPSVSSYAAGARENVFAGTPFATAPPPLRTHVIADAQTLMRRQGYYKGVVNGVFDPAVEFSLRAYQSSSGLQPTGRLDLDTLAALGLLPGQRRGIFSSRRRFPPQPLAQPPVRGEWIREPGVRRPDSEDEENDRD